MSAPLSWTNTPLTFRLRPADEERWIEQGEAALTPISHAETVASILTNRRAGLTGGPAPLGGPGLKWRDRNVRAAVVLEALIHSQREGLYYSRDTSRSAFPAMPEF